MVKIVLLSLFLTANVLAIEPPKGLEFGMTFEAAKSTLESSDTGKFSQLKVEDPKVYTKWFDSSYTVSQVKNVKLLDKKPERVWVLFDSTGALCGMQYIFEWQNDEKGSMFTRADKGRDKAWELLDELHGSLESKYGSPVKSYPEERKGTSLSDNAEFGKTWTDSTGNRIEASIFRKRMNAVIATADAYFVKLLYASPSFEESKKQSKIKDGDL